MPDATRSNDVAKRLLIATWLTWGFSVASLPVTAYLFAHFIKPDPTDDFGMGPFLSGAILGAILSILLGTVALVLHIKARQARPLERLPLSVLEWLVLVLPPALVFVVAASFVGAAVVGVPVLGLGLVILAFAKFRRTGS